MIAFGKRRDSGIQLAVCPECYCNKTPASEIIVAIAGGVSPKGSDRILRGLMLSSVAMVALLAGSGREAFALCAPPAAPGTPVSGTIVTCSGTTTNQNPLTGYGEGSQNGLTINVQGGASVIGDGAGFALGTGNTINNDGTISDHGTNPTTFNGVTEIFSASVIFNNNATGIISGTTNNLAANLVGINAGNVTGGNAGSIILNATGATSNEVVGINADNVTFTNTGTMTVTGSAAAGTFGIFGLTSVNVTNSGSITANGGTGATGTAIESAGSLSVTNLAGGMISGTKNLGAGSTPFTLGIFAAGTGSAFISNAGTIHGDGIGIASFSNTTNTIINTGTITGGLAGIRFFGTGSSSVENAGTIDGGAGAAIRFAGSNNILTLDPGSSITGAVTATGTDTFQLGGNGSATFDATSIGTQYTGFSTFNKIGSSTWTLTGTGSQNWDVQSGTLAANGAFTGAFAVDSGGTLAGIGTVGNTTIAAGGIFMPGSGTAGTSLNVNGTLGFAAGSTYAINVDPTIASFANVSGTATLNGATVNAIFAPGSYISKQYTILDAGSMSGTFGSLVNFNFPVNFSDNLSYDATHAFLNLVMLAPPTIPGGLNTNQQNVANGLINSFNVNGGIPAVFGSLTPAGLTEISGELGASFPQVAFQAGNSFLNLLLNPSLDGHFNSGGFGPIGYAEEKRPATDAFASVNRKQASAFDSRYGIWGGAYGGSGSIDGNATTGSHTTTAQTYGFAAGLDYRATPDTTIGFALAGGGTHWSLDQGLGSGRSDMFQAGLYGKTHWGAAYLAGALAYSFHDVTTNRTVTIAGTDQLQADFNANVFSGRLEGGYRYAMPWAGVTPYGAVQVQSIALPSYAEAATSGSNQFALSYASQTVTTTRTELGARFDNSYLLDRGAILTLFSRAAWAHDFGNSTSASAIFQTLPASNFIVNAAQPARDGALITAGAEYKLASGWSVLAKFDGEFSNTTAIYAGSGTIRKVW